MVFLIILLASAVYLGPTLINPDLFIGRPNDLQEFFWPLIAFAKKELFLNQALPLWNPHILSGTPLLPNPQAPLFYPPNLIFLITPIGLGFMLSIFIHIFLAGIFMYLLFRNGLGFSKFISVFAAISYIFTPRLSAYITAGHFGLICAFPYIPLALLAIKNLSSKFRLSWLTIYVISLTGLFLTHTITFGVVGLSSVVLYLFLSLQKGLSLEVIKKAFVVFLSSAVLFFGLNAVALLPQLEWAPGTTRFLLLKSPETHPKWEGFQSFFTALFPTSLLITGGTGGIDTEEWISVGLIASLLSIVGFTKIKLRNKLLVSLVVLIIIFISLNNLSPLYPLLIKQDWFKLMRVSTRVWIVIIIISIYFSCLGLAIIRKRWQTLSAIVAFALLLETLLLSWNRLTFPIEKPSHASVNVVSFLQKNAGNNRVFCLTRCISQKDATNFGLELADGYDTVQQTNYYKQFWQFTAHFWDYYTLTLPPMGIYIFEKIQPDLKALGDYNVLYIISPYEVPNSNLKEVSRIDGFIIYENMLSKSKAYFADDKSTSAQIIRYSPNFIRVRTTPLLSKNLTLALVYSPGWKAFLNGQKEVSVQEKSNGTQLVDLEPGTSFVDFKYSPDSFKRGLAITSLTILGLLAFLIKGKYVSRKP